MTRAAIGLGIGLLVAATVIVLGQGPARAHTPHDVVADVEISPAFEQDRTVYAIVRRDLLKSTDGGTTWKRLVRGLDNTDILSSITISGQDPRVLYVSSRSDGVYKSTDAGASWFKVGAGERGIVALEASPQTAEVVVARMSDGRLLVTRTGGASWSPVSGVSEVSALAFAPGAPELLLAGGTSGSLSISADAGQTWRSPSLVAPDAGGVTAIAASPTFAADSTIFAGTELGGIFKTTDGVTFTPANEGLRDRRVTSLALTSTFAADSTVWASTWDAGVFRSVDGGATWDWSKPREWRIDDETSEGLTTVSQADQLDHAHFVSVRVASGPTAPDAQTLFLGGFDGLFRSTDGGVRWGEVATQPASTIVAVAVSPDYVNDSTLAVATYVNGALRSTDGGETWEAVNNGLATRFEWLRARDYVARLLGITYSPAYAEDDTLFAGLRGYFLRSTNAGDDWDATIPRGVLVEGEFPADYFLMAPSPNFAQDDTIVLGTDGGKVFRSNDGGIEFDLVANVGREISSLVISPDFSSDEMLFAGTPDGVFVSADRGDTWVPTGQVPLPVTSVAISPNFGSDQTMFAGTRTGLFVTHDRARQWDRVVGTAVTDQGFVESVVVSPNFGNDATVLVSVRGEGLFKSEDGGETFRPVSVDLLAENIIFSSFYHPTSEPIVFSPGYATDQTVYAFTEAQVFKSVDGAETWTPVEIPTTIHETAESAYPARLLDSARFDSGRVLLSKLSARRVTASIAAGLVAFAVVTAVVRRIGRSWAWALVAGLGGGLVVFAVALVALTR